MKKVSAASDETEVQILHMEALELTVKHEKSPLTHHRLCSSDKRQSSFNYESSHGTASDHTWAMCDARFFLVRMQAEETPVINSKVLNLRLFSAGRILSEENFLFWCFFGSMMLAVGPHLVNRSEGRWKTKSNHKDSSNLFKKRLSVLCPRVTRTNPGSQAWG